LRKRFYIKYKTVIFNGMVIKNGTRSENIFLTLSQNQKIGK